MTRAGGRWCERRNGRGGSRQCPRSVHAARPVLGSRLGGKWGGVLDGTGRLESAAGGRPGRGGERRGRAQRGLGGGRRRREEGTGERAREGELGVLRKTGPVGREHGGGRKYGWGWIKR